MEPEAFACVPTVLSSALRAKSGEVCLKDARLIVVVNAHSIVLNDDANSRCSCLYLSVLYSKSDFDFTLRGRKLDRILHNVHEDLLDPIDVDLDMGYS